MSPSNGTQISVHHYQQTSGGRLRNTAKKYARFFFYHYRSLYHSQRPTDIQPFGLDRAVTTQKLLLQSTHQNGQ